MLPPNKQPRREDYATKNEYMKAWRVANAAHVREYNVDYKKNNAERVRERGREYYRENSARRTMNTDVRRGRITYSATLKVSGIWTEIQAIYAEARRKTEETGVLHSVDHIWPLNGKYSCGLHVPWNLQVIPQVDNDVKGNKEPHLWWEDGFNE